MDVKEKIGEVEKLNVKYNEDMKDLIEKRAVIDRQIGAIREECFRQQGEVRALKAVLDESEKESVN